ncbi:MAG: hypothetical protein QXS41_00080 [Candidatus Woesearchaeota archaeon]
MDPYNLEHSSKTIITETILLIVFLILSGIYLRIFILPINTFLDLNFQYISSLGIAFVLNPVVGLFFYFLKKSKFKTLGFFIVSPVLLIFAKNVETFLLILSFLIILLTFYLFKKQEYHYLKIYVQTILALMSLLILYTFLSNANYSEKVIDRLTKDFMSSEEYQKMIGSIDIPFVNFVFNLITIFLYGIYTIILFFPSFLTYVLLAKNNKTPDDLKPLNLSLTVSEPNKTNVNSNTQETKQEINQTNNQQNNQNLQNQNNPTDQNPNPSQNDNDPYAEIFKKYNLK